MSEREPRSDPFVPSAGKYAVECMWLIVLCWPLVLVILAVAWATLSPLARVP